MNYGTDICGVLCKCKKEWRAPWTDTEWFLGYMLSENNKMHKCIFNHATFCLRKGEIRKHICSSCIYKHTHTHTHTHTINRKQGTGYLQGAGNEVDAIRKGVTFLSITLFSFGIIEACLCSTCLKNEMKSTKMRRGAWNGKLMKPVNPTVFQTNNTTALKGNGVEKNPKPK